MKLLIELDEEYVKAIDKIKFLVGGRADRKLQLEIIKAIKNGVPPEQEPKTGEWIEHFDESGKWYECDQCHTDWGGAVNFCPDCGADMRGEK